jgi:ADP-glucose pyrophosphorylase
LIDQESVLENVVLLPGVIIRSGVRLKNAIVNKQTIIPKDFVSETEQVRLFSGEHFREEAKTIG